MKPKVAEAMALVLLIGAVGLAVVPVVTAGHNNCHEDFYITGTTVTRELPAGESEIGQANVSKLQDEVLTVKLITDGVQLRIVDIYELSGQTCESSTNVPDCSFPIDLDTTGSETTDSVNCTLKADSVNDREFDVKMESLETSNSLEYEIHSD